MFRTLYASIPYETPFSIMTALVNTTRDRKIRSVARQTVRRGPKLLHTCPCRLTRFCALTDNFYGEVHQVLTERTLYPLYFGCMSKVSTHRLESQVCDGARSRSCGATLPVQFHSENRYGIECPECSEYANLAIGRRCSLSFHCIPLQTRCPMHGCRYRLADECSSIEFKMLAFPDTARAHNSVRLSETLFDFLGSTRPHCQVDTIISLLHERGYMAENGRVKRAALSKDFEAIHSQGFEDIRLNTWITSGSMIVHMLKCITHPEICPHPVEIALLKIALSNIEYAPKQVRTISGTPVQTRGQFDRHAASPRYRPKKGKGLLISE